MNLWNEFHGPNAGYVLELYQRYQQDPASVDAAVRDVFERWTPPTDGAAPVEDVPALGKVVGAVNLAQAIREFGLLAAQLDPLGTPPPGDPAISPAYHGLSEDDLRRLPASLVGGPVAEGSSSAFEAIEKLRAIYSSRIGYDYGHVRIPEEREWLRDVAEAGRFRPPHDPIDYRELLERLTQVEVFEQFLHRTFPGKTRFSIEGLDMLVPILDELVGGAAEHDIYSILMGMAHRGRLNVLAHTLGKPYEKILAEFKDPVPYLREDTGWTGDVKYHMGARRAIKDGEAVDVVVAMAPNPSHLEFVNPVVEGMARAAGTYVDQPGPPRFDHKVSLPVLIHGDAAFPGQGVVAETLNFSRLPGYRTGGSIHIIANNQLGFTTTPDAAYSALFASDLAKGFKIPIIHVNADDPEACIEAVRTALAYRARFLKDFLIDLVGYRRHGHNEGDEPAFTQPRMYQKIERQPTVRQLWGGVLVERGLIEEQLPDELVRRQMEQLQRIYDSLQSAEARIVPALEMPPPGAARRVKTAVPAEKVRELNEALIRTPEDFNVHPKLERAFARRRNALDDPAEQTIDWAMAEDLALASILADGTSIRLTGQDVERGTFSHRHAVFHDVENGKTFTPLQSLPQARAAFEIRNSPLTESAVVGFEYGYNVHAPERLVIWEAQYGDFVNGAQVMLDEFVVSGRAKWEQSPSLVLLLPHGHEGQGPDHATGRPERFLQMAAETNMRIVNCTTAAQYFHLLRRQAALLQTDPLPLVVFTPKSLLRHRRAFSSLQDLTQGGWQPVIDDERAQQSPEQVRRLILCTGKVFVDMVSSDRWNTASEVALVRVEQLYPFPEAELRAVLERYTELSEVVWLQEEPENMGAWSFMQPRLSELIGGRWPLSYIGRPKRSSPAEGSASWHAATQKAIIERAFTLEPVVTQKR